MQLSVPAGSVGQLEAGPIFQTAEAFMQAEPVASSVLCRMFWMRIDPVLERIDASNPRKDVDDSLEMLSLRPFQIFAVGVKFLEVLASEQFHAHGSHFAKFNRCMAVVSQGLVTSRED